MGCKCFASYLIPLFTHINFIRNLCDKNTILFEQKASRHIHIENNHAMDHGLLNHHLFSKTAQQAAASAATIKFNKKNCCWNYSKNCLTHANQKQWLQSRTHTTHVTISFLHQLDNGLPHMTMTPVQSNFTYRPEMIPAIDTSTSSTKKLIKTLNVCARTSSQIRDIT